MTQNDETENKLSEEKPYSVKVRSYKEEQAAENDKQRLLDQNIDAYTIKTFDDKSLFSFDLHAGAFGNEEEAESLQDKLAGMGIHDTEVSSYEDILPLIEKYNEVVNNETVSVRDGNAELPDILSPFLQKNLRQFPINRNFVLKGLDIYDLDNCRKLEKECDSLCMSRFLLNQDSFYHCFTSAVYHDSLLNNDVTIEIAVGEPGCVMQLPVTASAKFSIPNDELTCIIDVSNDLLTLFGTNGDRSLGVVMISYGFDRERFIDFINNFDNDSNLLIFPEVRRSLCVLPNENPDVERTFKYFTLSQPDDSYAAERSYSDWSMAIVGHWEASGYFNQNGNMSVAFFDLDYDYNASYVHQLFMQAHSNSRITDNNHSSEINNLDAWYVSNSEGNEFSFSKYSYIIAINSDEMGEDDLHVIADDLKIWDPSENVNMSFNNEQ